MTKTTVKIELFPNQSPTGAKTSRVNNGVALKLCKVDVDCDFFSFYLKTFFQMKSEHDILKKPVVDRKKKCSNKMYRILMVH